MTRWDVAVLCGMLRCRACRLGALDYHSLRNIFIIVFEIIIY